MQLHTGSKPTYLASSLVLLHQQQQLGLRLIPYLFGSFSFPFAVVNGMLFGGGWMVHVHPLTSSPNKSFLLGIFYRDVSSLPKAPEASSHGGRI